MSEFHGAVALCVFAAAVAIVCVSRIERAVEDIKTEAERCRNASLEFASTIRRMRGDMQYDLNAHTNNITHAVQQINHMARGR